MSLSANQAWETSSAIFSCSNARAAPFIRIPASLDQGRHPRLVFGLVDAFDTETDEVPAAAAQLFQSAFQRKTDKKTGIAVRAALLLLQPGHEIGFCFQSQPFFDPTSQYRPSYHLRNCSAGRGNEICPGNWNREYPPGHHKGGMGPLPADDGDDFEQVRGFPNRLDGRRPLQGRITTHSRLVKGGAGGRPGCKNPAQTKERYGARRSGSVRSSGRCCECVGGRGTLAP